MSQLSQKMYSLLIPIEERYGSITKVPTDDQINTSTVHVLQRLMSVEEE